MAKKEHQRRHYIKNSEAMKRKASEYYYKNHEVNIVKRREYYLKNRAKLLEKSKVREKTKRQERNAYRRNRLFEKKSKAVAYKGGHCMDCSVIFHLAVFEFHHIDPDIKDKSVAFMLCGSWEKA